MLNNIYENTKNNKPNERKDTFMKKKADVKTAKDIENIILENQKIKILKFNGNNSKLQQDLFFSLENKCNKINISDIELSHYYPGDKKIKKLKIPDKCITDKKIIIALKEDLDYIMPLDKKPSVLIFNIKGEGAYPLRLSYI